MYQIRRHGDHFRFTNDWLDARWHFSFSHYHDAENINFGPLRVLNDDVIQGESGFGLHPHRDMEIVTVLKGGTLSHYDTKGHQGHIRPGEVQKMSAGSGIQHSEWNYAREPVELLQIWFMPAVQGIAPGYDQEQYTVAPSGLTIVGSPGGHGGGVPIVQDAVLAIGDTASGLDHLIAPGRGLYLHVIDGRPVVDGEELSRGDAVRVSWEQEHVSVQGEGRVLLIDVPLRDERERSTLLLAS
jgi:quercetin 2,3-dioxygenase